MKTTAAQLQQVLSTDWLVLTLGDFQHGKIFLLDEELSPSLLWVLLDITDKIIPLSPQRVSA